MFEALTCCIKDFSLYQQLSCVLEKLPQDVKALGSGGQDIVQGLIQGHILESKDKVTILIEHKHLHHAYGVSQVWCLGAFAGYQALRMFWLSILAPYSCARLTL